MKIIEPSATLYGPVPTDPSEAIKFIEQCGRLCYKSEDKITDTSAEPFVKRLIKAGHLAMVEHSNFVVRAANPDMFAPSVGKYLNVFKDQHYIYVGGNLTAWLNYANETRIFSKPFLQEYKELFSLPDCTTYSYSAWQVCPHAEIPTELHRYSAKFICDRGVTHELVRHRPASYAQECLSGDTVVCKGITVKDLYERSLNQFGKTHNKTIRLRSAVESGAILPNKMVAVWKKGIAPVFEVTTSLGYKIKTTLNHEFMQNNGFKKLSDLKVGDAVMVNGRPSLVRVEDSVITEMYKTLSTFGIARELEVPYGSVKRRLQQLGIFQKHKNDDDPEKYNKNHTQESYDKMSATLLQQYKKWRDPWNKGLTEDHPSVKVQADALRANHYNNKPGELCSNWKGGVSQKFYVAKKVGITKCELCGDPPVHVHHIDEDRKNSADPNLIKVCQNCHDKLHHGWYVGKKIHPDFIVSIIQMGVEDVYDIEMEAPYNNFIANGFVVHNSTRYVNYDGKHMEFIEPAGFEEWGNPAILAFKQSCSFAEIVYQDFLNNGFKPQQARAVLPNALKTEIIVTADAAEWRHIFKLRTAMDAHPDMRRVMVPLREEFKEKYPEAFE